MRGLENYSYSWPSLPKLCTSVRPYSCKGPKYRFSTSTHGHDFQGHSVYHRASALTQFSEQVFIVPVSKCGRKCMKKAWQAWKRKKQTITKSLGRLEKEQPRLGRHSFLCLISDRTNSIVLRLNEALEGRQKAFTLSSRRNKGSPGEAN